MILKEAVRNIALGHCNSLIIIHIYPSDMGVFDIVKGVRNSFVDLVENAHSIVLLLLRFLGVKTFLKKLEKSEKMVYTE